MNKKEQAIYKAVKMALKLKIDVGIDMPKIWVDRENEELFNRILVSKNVEFIMEREITFIGQNAERNKTTFHIKV